MGEKGSLIDLLILSLAVWRWASFLAREEGPFYIFTTVRHWLGVRYNEKSEMVATNHWAEGALCLWCNSMWFALLFEFCYAWYPAYTVWVLLPFALSAAAIALEAKCP